MPEFDVPSRNGYLLWRYREASQRHDFGDDSTPKVIMASVLAEERELLSTLIAEHGLILDNPSLADAAFVRELQKLDSTTKWTSPRGVRRARGTVSFLRRAVILSFCSDQVGDQLQQAMKTHKPPLFSNREASQHVRAVYSNLTQLIDSIDELFAHSETRRDQLLERGHDELQQLKLDLQKREPLALSHQHAEPASAVRLPFIVLPPGKGTQSFFTGLSSRAAGRDRVLDPDRRRLIEQLREKYGSARCTMYRGVFRSDDDDDAYIVMVITLPSGKEHAVAISPWKGEHATFVVRGDCAAGRTWIEVLALSKAEAKDLGAKRLVFASNQAHGMDQYQAMRQKLICLLECSTYDFEHGSLAYDQELRRYAMRVRTASQKTATARSSTARRASAPPLPKARSVSKPTVIRVPTSPPKAPAVRQASTKETDSLGIWARFVRWLRGW